MKNQGKNMQISKILASLVVLVSAASVMADSVRQQVTRGDDEWYGITNTMDNCQRVPFRELLRASEQGGEPYVVRERKFEQSIPIEVYFSFNVIGTGQKFETLLYLSKFRCMAALRERVDNQNAAQRERMRRIERF